MAFPLISENVPHQEQQSEKMLIMDYIYFSAKRAHSVCTFKFMYMLHSSFQFSRENQKLYSHNANFFSYSESSCARCVHKCGNTETILAWRAMASGGYSLWLLWSLFWYFIIFYRTKEMVVLVPLSFHSFIITLNYLRNIWKASRKIDIHPFDLSYSFKNERNCITKPFLLLLFHITFCIQETRLLRYHHGDPLRRR